MRSTYKKLGPYIREIDVRNTEASEEGLLGLSVSKTFLPTKANTIGTNFSNYKIVERGQFSYTADTSRRGDKIAIALLDQWDRGMVSPIYTVFEIIDEEQLLPDYLMMWFRRPEFNRYARFKSHGSVRELFGWDEMCDMELPIPSIEKQREIVKEYQTVVDRIRLNERLNEKLEEAAQAIYKQWFVDFEFPMPAEVAQSIGKPEMEGQPYKSSGGEMEFNEILKQEIPKGWKCAELERLASVITKGTTPATMYSEPAGGRLPYVKGESITEMHGVDEQVLMYIDHATNKALKRSILHAEDLLFSIAGTLGKFALASARLEGGNCNQAICIIRLNLASVPLHYIMGLFLSKWHAMFYAKNVQQAVQANLSLTTIRALPVLMPEANVLEAASRVAAPFVRTLESCNLQIETLRQLAGILLQRMAIGRS